MFVNFSFFARSYPSVLQATGLPEVKDQLKTVTEEAQKRGAFGGPTIFVGGEMYFGSDRFELIAQRIGE